MHSKWLMSSSLLSSQSQGGPTRTPEYRRLPFSSSISFLVLSSVLFHRFVISADGLTPRGVPLSRAALYDPQKDFSCLDGSKLIPFSFVNDDYCDCRDGSDEPGTSACSRGSFFCLNAGHVSIHIPSSRVNDQVCDCCDGTDEYTTTSRDDNGVECPNTCDEMGRVAREEGERQARLAREGYHKRLELSQKGKEMRREKEDEKNRLEVERQKAEQVKQEKEELKIEMEKPEKLALDKYHKHEEEKRKKEDEEEKLKADNEAENLFNLIDSNGDEKISMDEIKVRQTFDRNKDGEVSDKEAMFFLNMEEEMSKEDFLKTGWLLAKPFFLMEQGMFTPPEPVRDEENEESQFEGKEELPEEGVGYAKDFSGGLPVTTEPPLADYEDDEAEDNPEEPKSELSGLDENESAEEEHAEETEEQEPEPEPEQKYDEETRALIEQADKARLEYGDAERAMRDVEKTLEEVNDALNLDFGEDERFAPMYGQCYDFEDREYIYTLCPYKSASQRGRSGGGEVNLGKWGSWSGPEIFKYSHMLYDKGQSCWNGPNRSAKVSIGCGVESQLVGVSEPSRCEYQFEFITPAACEKPETSSTHDEL